MATVSFTRRGAAPAQTSNTTPVAASPLPAKRGRRATAEEAKQLDATIQNAPQTAAVEVVAPEAPRFRGTAPAVEVVAPGTRSVVPSAPAAVSQWATNRAKAGQLVGEFKPSDLGAGIKLAILSEKSPKFRDLREWVDQFVLGDQYLVGPEAYFIVTSLTKKYQEDTEFDSGDVGETFDSEAAARASGRKFSEFVIMNVLLESPSEDTDDLVDGIESGGKGYIPAVMYLRGSSMAVVRGLLKDLEDRGPLKGDLASHIYKAVPDRHEKAGAKGATVWFTPKLTIEEPVSPDLRELIAAKIGV